MFESSVTETKKLQWHTLDVTDFGLARVSRDDGWMALMDKSFQIVTEWFPRINPFWNGFFCVEKEENKYNYLDTNLKWLSEIDFFDARDFCCGHARVSTIKDGVIYANILDTKGQLLLDNLYAETFEIVGKWVRVSNQEGKQNYVNLETRRTFLKYWYSEVKLDEYDYIRAKCGNCWFVFDSQGIHVSDFSFDYIGPYSEGFFVVYLNDRWNYLNATNGNLISKRWRKGDARNFESGFAIIKRYNSKWNLINRQGKFLSRRWFDYRREGLDLIRGQWYIVNKYGERKKVIW